MGLIALLVAAAGCGSDLEFQIGSSSMEPSLQGPAYQARCSVCAATQRVSVDSYRPELATRCVLCGGSCQVDSQASPGQRIHVDPLPLQELPDRLAVVALESEGGQGVMVKRAWGLPGERIEIRDGDLWINGKRLQKTMDEFKRMSVEVSQYPQRPVGRWSIANRGKQYPMVSWFEKSKFTLQSDHRLQWTYTRPAAVYPQETNSSAWLIASPIVDDLPANQGLSYTLQVVQDWGISLELAEPISSPTFIALQGTALPIQVQLVPLGWVTVDPQTSELQVNAGAANGAGKWSAKSGFYQAMVTVQQQVDIAVVDGRLLVSSDVEDRQYDLSPLRVQSVDHKPLSTDLPPARFVIEPRGGALVIRRLAVLRDIYLRTTHRDGGGREDYGIVPPDHLFVLGDNPPASVDSRHDFGFRPASSILGTVRVPQR